MSWLIPGLALLAAGYAANDHASKSRLEAAERSNNWAVDQQRNLDDKRIDELTNQVQKYSADRQADQRQKAQQEATARLQGLFVDEEAEQPTMAADVSDAYLQNKQATDAATALDAQQLASNYGRMSGMQSVENARNRDRNDFNARQKRHSAVAKQIQNMLQHKLVKAGQKNQDLSALGSAAMAVGGAMVGNAAGAAAGGAGAAGGATAGTTSSLGSLAAGAAATGAGYVANNMAEQEKTDAANKANREAIDAQSKLSDERVQEVVDNMRRLDAGKQRAQREDAQAAAVDRITALFDEEGDAEAEFAGDVSTEQVKDQARAAAAKSEVGRKLAQTFGRLGGIEALEQQRQRDQRTLSAKQLRHAAAAKQIDAALRRKLAAAQEEGGTMALLAQLLQSYGTSAMGGAVSGVAGAGNYGDSAVVSELMKNVGSYA